MDKKTQITIRSKKLGVLIRDARLAARRKIKECADAIGVKSGVFHAYEEGRKSPSLPELETLVYYLDLPIDHFWSREIRSNSPLPIETLDLPKLLAVRQRKIGALLRQERTNASISIRNLAQETGISAARIKAYELGERPIPLPELEALVSALGGRIETFFDRSGPIGQWMMNEEAIQNFLDLPEELRQFVSMPVNRPYLELAVKLSAMSRDKLRSVAEDLLDITL
ncbi:MAG: helix-turn-helix domain-containing protein [Anaerolineales bacterium]|nr:helix-turn-helix domain-containing protein [Anaerolineales bacterium]NUQ83145.1 helix-turn-helix transcriptional regulator [Anaerolineales bacterium]